MIEDIEIFYKPMGQMLPSLGARALVDVSDGDTPNIRMPIRMLSVDTPEVTARSETGAQRVDVEFAQLAQWIKQGKAPVSPKFADYIVPRLETGTAGTLQYQQGKSASEFFKAITEKRLKKPNGGERNMFLRSAEQPFDGYGRLLAYVAPSYSKKERESMPRKQRATFNLNLIESGWAQPFILYPSIPNELDLKILIEAACEAMTQKKGQYEDELFLPAYEYRMCEKLYDVTKDMVEGESVSFARRMGWRSRYCLDMRDRRIYGPEDYMDIPAPYRIWVWPEDLQEAIGMLNLVPKQRIIEPA